MRPTRAIFITCVMGMGLVGTGCTQLRTHEGYIVDDALLSSVSPGIDNRASVERTLGQPTIASQFGTVNGAGAITNAAQASDWYYVSRNNRALAFRRPRTHEQLLVHIRFDALGNVAMVDRSGVERVVRVSPNSDATPTLGRHRSFFEELFGNIGTVGAAGAGAPGGGAGGPGGG